MDLQPYIGRRLAYDGSLCTIRYHGPLAGTKGDWLGVEWDDISRGKHDGQHQGRRIFDCLSSAKTAASFLRPNRKADQERTLLEAISFKYASESRDAVGPYITEAIIISGKAAEEVGFDKVAREQSRLVELKVAILEDLVINSIAQRGSNRKDIFEAQQKLATTCPNITELDLGWNPIEEWRDIADICSALPKLRILRASGLRLRSFERKAENGETPFANIREIYLDECLIDLNEAAIILREPSEFPMLQTLSLSKNDLDLVNVSVALRPDRLSFVRTLLFENNRISNLSCLTELLSIFPKTTTLSFQGNQINSIRTSMESESFPQLVTLNLSHNNVTSYDVIDDVSRIFPHLSSLRISNNPLYDHALENDPPSSKVSERSYYLTLARIPGLKSLNYTQITSRDREEGELYYLSVSERTIKDIISENPREPLSLIVQKVQRLLPQYMGLCSKYQRDSCIEQVISNMLQADEVRDGANQAKEERSEYPQGSLGRRLVDTKFYLSHDKEETFKRPLPRTIPVNTLKALLVRQFPRQLQPLRFRLIYESHELDPVELTTESSTRSQAYNTSADGQTRSQEDRWREWGDWNADATIEAALVTMDNHADGRHDSTGEENTAKWMEEGYFIKQGRKWKRREVELLGGMRGWGDWIEDGVDVVKIRIERIE